MATSLYDLSVPTFLQTLRAVGGFLDQAAKHCTDIGADPDDFVRARLFEDMAPFHFQIEATWHHSVWGLEAVRTGVFSPPALVGPVPFADLQGMIGKAQRALEAFTPDEVNGWTAGKARLRGPAAHSAGLDQVWIHRVGLYADEHLFPSRAPAVPCHSTPVTDAHDQHGI